MIADIAAIESTAIKLLKTKSVPSAKQLNRKVKASYGVNTKIILAIWNRLIVEQLLPTGSLFKHLFWALAFLKTYDTEHLFSMAYGTSEKTFRQWVWKFILAISRLDVVSPTG